MSWLTRLARRNRMEQQLDKELQVHLEQHAAGLMARCASPEEARRLARIALGAPERIRW